MFVAASTACFPDLSPTEVLELLNDLRFTAIELPIRESGGWPRPSLIQDDFERSVHLCRDTHRLNVAALDIELAPGPDYYQQFNACCKLAKAVKVASLVVPAAELGTPFNEEIERLRKLVEIASLESAVVGLKTQIGTMTQDPDTAVVLCNQVPGLRLTLDPSHYITGPHQGGNIDKVMKYVQHVHLRDSTKDKLQVRVGQGDIDYGKLIGQLNRVGYDRALCVQMTPMEGFDHRAEMRKLRLLLDSLL
ncbi:MAG: sugar phosphate isomerase/epimerase [Planctomycetes bacterium]|nr:sugar phosphate isomerase/epimerase [Planctomycetota bacterium]